MGQQHLWIGTSIEAHCLLCLRYEPNLYMRCVLTAVFKELTQNTYRFRNGRSEHKFIPAYREGIKRVEMGLQSLLTSTQEGG